MQRISESHVTCPPVPEYLQARFNCSEMTNPRCICYKPFITSSVIGNSLWMAMTKTTHWLRWTSKKQDTAWVWILCYWYCNYENKLRVRITPPLAVVLFGSADRRFKSQRHILIRPVLSDSDASQRCHASTREASALRCHSLVDFIYISWSLPPQPIKARPHSNVLCIRSMYNFCVWEGHLRHVLKHLGQDWMISWVPFHARQDQDMGSPCHHYGL